MGSTGPASAGRVLPWFFAATARFGRQQGRLDELPVRGADVWLTPGSSDVGPLTVLRSGLVLAPLRLGPSRG